MDTRVSVIVNVSSGSQKISGFSADLAGRFKSGGVEAEIRLAEPAEIVAEVRRAAIIKPRLIVIGGGDGTLNAATPLLVCTDPLRVAIDGEVCYMRPPLHLPGASRSAVRRCPRTRSHTVAIG